MEPSKWEWVQVALVVVNLTWTTLCLGGYRPETMVITSALNGALLAVHLFGWAVGWGMRTKEPEAQTARRLHPAGWLLVPFLVYAAANVRWVTPVPWIGWRDWLGWAQMIGVFWVVLNGVRSNAGRAILFWSLVALACVAVGLGCYQRFVDPNWLTMGRVQVSSLVGRASGPFGIPNSLAALLLLVSIPVAAAVFRRGATVVQRVFLGYVALLLALGLGLTISRGAWLALVLVLAVWPLVASRDAWWRRGAIAAAAIVGLAATMIVLFLTVPLVQERLSAMKSDLGERTRPVMWRGAWKIFEERPVWGGGAGSFAVRFEKYRPAWFQDETGWAHNDYLNTLSDYGAVGLSLFFGAGAVIAWKCVRSGRVGSRLAEEEGVKNRWQAGSCLNSFDDCIPLSALNAGIVAFGLQLFVDFHFKIPALAMAFAVVAALAVQRAWAMPVAGAGPRSWERDACIFGGTFVVAGTIWLVNPLYRSEALRYQARQAIDAIAVRDLTLEEWRPVLAEVAVKLGRATRIDPKNGAAWADVSYATALYARVEPGQAHELGRKAEAMARQALACSPAVPEFWARLGVALDLQGRQVEGGAPFVEALSLAPANAVFWYYQAAHLSLNPVESNRALAAAAFCLRLDPGNRAAQALRQRLADRSRAP